MCCSSHPCRRRKHECYSWPICANVFLIFTHLICAIVTSPFPPSYHNLRKRVTAPWTWYDFILHGTHAVPLGFIKIKWRNRWNCGKPPFRWGFWALTLPQRHCLGQKFQHDHFPYHIIDLLSFREISSQDFHFSKILVFAWPQLSRYSLRPIRSEN